MCKKPHFCALGLLGAFLTLSASAQQQPTWEQLGDRYFVTWQFDKAVPVYQKLSGQKRAKPFVFYRLGYSAEMLGDPQSAIAAYRACISRDSGADSLWIRIGDLFKMQELYDSARQAYARYPAGGPQAARARIRIDGCDSAQAWLAHPETVRVRNEDRINTTLSDWGAFRHENQLWYTSNFNRLNSIDQRISSQTHEPYFAVFRWNDSKADANRVDVDDLAQVLNVSHFHAGPVCYAGDTAYLTVSRPGRPETERMGWKRSLRVGTRRLELFLVAGGKVSAFPYNDPGNFSVGHAAIAPDGRALYFVSDRPGGFGGTDIWYSVRGADGSWGAPVNCGAGINTADDEMFPVFQPDGSLTFASEGHAGMGGLDLFNISGSETGWSAPRNLRPPFNSGRDDFHFISTDSLSGYFASDRPGGKGSDDIYAFAIIPPPPPPPAPPPPPPPPKKGDVLVLQDLYYDFDKFAIRYPDATRVLDSLAVILQDHPTIRISLESHTDSRGNDAYNMRLSERRAESAVQYLVQKGIARSRLEWRGLGESQLVNRCGNNVECSEEEHQANRRTEVRILED